MNQLQFYKYTTWGLLLLNIALVAFFFLAAPKPPKNKASSGQKVADILQLDKQQDESFLKLAQEHNQRMESFGKQQRDLLEPYFHSLIQQVDPLELENYLNQIQTLEREKVEYTYRHFQDVKAILNPEQHIHFEAFIEHAIGRILIEMKKKPPPPKDFE